MGQRGRKIKAFGKDNARSDVFYMSLEEAKLAISDKYEYMVDRYEQRPKSKRLT